MNVTLNRFNFSRIFIHFICCLFIVNSIGALTLDPLFLQKADSIIALNSEEQITLVESRKEEHTIFQCLTVTTLEHPFERVAHLLSQWEHHATKVKYVRRVLPIFKGKSDTLTNTYFIEMGAWLAVSWFIGDMSIEIPHDSSIMKITFKQDLDSKGYEKWKKEAKGLFKVEYHDFIMWYQLIDLGNNQTRIALLGFVEPKVWIPRWLFKVTANKIFPRMVNVFETALLPKN